MKHKKALIAAGIALGLGLMIFLVVRGQRNNAAPSWADHSARLKELNGELDAALAEIKKYHGGSKCDDATQCKVVGLGQESCGGHNDFLIYSVKDADEQSLLAYVQKYNRLATEFNNLSLNVPSCGKQPKRPACVRNECVPTE